MKEYFIAARETAYLTSGIQPQVVDNGIVDMVLIGAGVMSATLGTYLQILEPGWTVHMYERLGNTAQESSHGWNNAGTGHAAFCELNYTTINKNGSIDISKAISVNESFEISRQFWSYLVISNFLKNPQSFINNVPHMSMVWGEEDVLFLRQRFNKLQDSTLFRGMEYSEDLETIQQWAPLVMHGRNNFQQVTAATRMTMGTDINFGEMTQQMVATLKNNPNFHMYLKHDVVDIKRHSNKIWNICISDRNHGGRKSTVCARYVFIGAGGASLRLLQKTGIPEVKGYAGFPIGGQFLVATNPAVVNANLAKVYGKALVGAPPMSVPHMDTRILDGKRFLLFGPFATFSSKFLKQGSWLDFFRSLTCRNLLPMLQVGVNNFTLIHYLIGQLMMSEKDRLNALREYYPQAKLEDWTLIKAGQRVQLIKKDPKKGGVLQFGTEVISASDGTLSSLLGASPGASTAPFIILEVLGIMFKQKIVSDIWQRQLKKIIPSYGQSLNGNLALTNEIRRYTCSILGLTYLEAKSFSVKIKED